MLQACLKSGRKGEIIDVENPYRFFPFIDSSLLWTLGLIHTRPKLCLGRTGGKLQMNQPVKLEKQPVQVQDFGKFTGRFR